MSEHITFFIKENENSEMVDIDELMNSVETTELNDELFIPQMINYNEQYTVKELLTICEYYGFAKNLKVSKCNKQQILQCLIAFELDPNNSELVFARQNLWFYITELKKDPFMKKFVIW